MGKSINVTLKFINQKGDEKEVSFYIEKLRYEGILHNSVSEDVRQKYLEDAYHEYERERKNRKKYVLVSDIDVIQKFMNDEGSLSSEEAYFKELERMKVKDAIRNLTEEQQELIQLIYYEGLTQKEAADKLGVSKQAVFSRLQRIYDKLRKYLKNTIDF